MKTLNINILLTVLSVFLTGCDSLQEHNPFAGTGQTGWEDCIHYVMPFADTTQWQFDVDSTKVCPISINDVYDDAYSYYADDTIVMPIMAQAHWYGKDGTCDIYNDGTSDYNVVDGLGGIVRRFACPKKR